MTVLVLGGAGYIGSHNVAALCETGHKVIVFDNLEKGHKEAVWPGAQLIVGDLRDYGEIEKVFQENKGIDAVIHFAAYSLVGESVAEPLKYYENNVLGTLNLLKAMATHCVQHIVFSSTASTFGQPESLPILEDFPQSPTNPYGETKLAVEKMLKWADGAYGIKYAVLRYFNVAGAHESGKIGEDHNPESHLIPNIIDAALGKRDKVEIFGSDYPTPDGTCVRDYIHVMDLVDAHILALNKIMETGESRIYNLGNGKGFSNLEILQSVARVTGREIHYTLGPRRAGDPAELVASSEKIMRELNWKPRLGRLDDIIQSAWQWHEGHPNGYGGQGQEGVRS